MVRKVSGLFFKENTCVCATHTHADILSIAFWMPWFSVSEWGKALGPEHLKCFCFQMSLDSQSLLWKWDLSERLTCFLKNLYAGQEATVSTRHGKTDWFKIRKRVRHGCVLSPTYLASMQSTSCKMLGWTKCKPKSGLLGEISITSDADNTILW